MCFERIDSRRFILKAIYFAVNRHDIETVRLKGGLGTISFFFPLNLRERKPVDHFIVVSLLLSMERYFYIQQIFHKYLIKIFLIEQVK